MQMQYNARYRLLHVTEWELLTERLSRPDSNREGDDNE